MPRTGDGAPSTGVITSGRNVAGSWGAGPAGGGAAPVPAPGPVHPASTTAAARTVAARRARRMPTPGVEAGRWVGPTAGRADARESGGSAAWTQVPYRPPDRGPGSARSTAVITRVTVLSWTRGEPPERGDADAAPRPGRARRVGPADRGDRDGPVRGQPAGAVLDADDAARHRAGLRRGGRAGLGPSPEQRDRALFCAGAVVWLVSGLVNTDYPAFIAAGQLVATVPVAIVLHALLAFPSGRLTPPVPPAPCRPLGYLVTTVVLAPQYLFPTRRHCPCALRPALRRRPARRPRPSEPPRGQHRGRRARCWPPPLYWCTGSPPPTGAGRHPSDPGPVYAYGAVAVVGVWGGAPPTSCGGCTCRRLCSRSCRSCCWRACRWPSWRGCCAAASRAPRSSTSSPPGSPVPAGEGYLGGALSRALGDPALTLRSASPHGRLRRLGRRLRHDVGLPANGRAPFAPDRAGRPLGRGPRLRRHAIPPIPNRSARPAGSRRSHWTASGSPRSCWPARRSCATRVPAWSRPVTGSAAGWPRTCTTGCRDA